MSEEPLAADDSVRGERSTPVTHRVRSIQSRLNSVLAIGLMAALGVGLLAWYYTRAFDRPVREQKTAQTAAANRAKSEMSLPALGKIQQPVYESLFGPKPPLPAGAMPSWANTRDDEGGEGPAAARPSGTPTSRPSAFERRLSGPVLSIAEEKPGAHVRPSDTSADSATASREPEGDSSFAVSLQATTTPAVSARMLPTQRWLLPKGAFIDCTLETAIDSTLPGMATCITATDTFGADGQIVLLERGTKLVGETRSQSQQGSARIFVLWTEARTPTGVVVPLASPGTDELGRSGLPGRVKRHFWDRFGAALLISTIEGAVESSTRSSRGDTIIFNPSRSSDIATEVLTSTADIRPSVIKNQGDRIQVLVARDLDFRSVYELRAAAASR